MLCEGKIVKVDSLGSLKVTLQELPAYTEEERDKSNIIMANVFINHLKD